MPRNVLRTGTLRAHLRGVTRKLVLILAALLLPGGLIALLGAWFFRALAQTERGQKVLKVARERVPAWVTTLRAPIMRPQRQAA
jgi:hypothetical protein